jgi:steroid 5-alpha reductase family enzyme
MKIKHFINLHKGLTFPVVFGMMWAYQNFTVGAWVYLALHGTYGFLWLLKDQIYPDQRFEEEATWGIGIFTWILLGLYWVAPWVLISSGSVPPPPLIGVAVAAYTFGIFLHYTSDAQKYYTLKYHPGLITEGLFARSRNINYLGEILIYGAFALLTQHWLPFVILGLFFLAVFLPGMRSKDKSLSRHPEFAAYKNRSGLLLPNFFTKGEAGNIVENQTT